VTIWIIDGNNLIVMGLSVILIALAFANKKMTRDDDKT